MRARSLLLTLLLLPAFLMPTAVRAEDEPAPAPPKPEVQPEPPKPAPESDTPTKEEAEEETEVVTEEAELDAPQAKLRALQMSVRRAPRSERATILKEGATAYLKDAEADEAFMGAMDPADHLALGRIREMAQDWPGALGSHHTLMQDEKIPAAIRAQACAALASLASRMETEDAPAEKVAQYIEDVSTYAAATRGPETNVAVASAYMALARVHDSAGKTGEVMDAWMRCAELNPAMAYSAARSISRALMGTSHDVAVFPVLKVAAKGFAGGLEESARRHVANLEGRLAEMREGDASDGAIATMERNIARARSSAGRVGRAFSGLDMLGKDAPDWTLTHAFGDVSQLPDLKGKVVMLDFWATWCPWCIRSFPAMRDLLKSYEDQGLVIVGITTSSSAVWEERYNLDDDFKEKSEGNAPPVARRARSAGQVDPDKGIYDAEAYGPIEQAAIKTFIGNHEMTWPVVMIDGKEPGPKYGLTGWPHAVFLDRQGRVRYLKAGALLRSDTATVAKTRKLIEALLAEKAE